MQTRTATRSIAFAFVLLTLCACGGGAGDQGEPPADVSLLDGAYCAFGMVLQNGTPDFGGATWGVLTFDGLGGTTGTLGGNTNGVIIPPTAIPPGSYTVAADRTASLTVNGTTYIGTASPSGVTMGGADIGLGSDPAAALAVKIAGVFSNASLNGTWCVAGFEVSTGGQSSGLWGLAGFNGAGSVTMNVNRNTEGVTTAGTNDVGAYNVAANGQFVYTFNDGRVYEGCLLEGGNVLIMTGANTGGQAPGWYVMVKKISGATNALLNGNYTMLRLERNNASGWTSSVGSVASDGAGSLTVTRTANSDGGISALPAVISPYAVAADGSLTVSPAGSPTDVLAGSVSLTGNYAMLGGTTNAGGLPSFSILIRD